MQKLILSLFTFWLGVSGTLSTPLMMVGAGFKVIGIERVYAEAPPPAPAVQNTVAQCNDLVNTSNTLVTDAQQKLNEFGAIFTSEATDSIQHIVDTVKAKYERVISKPLPSVDEVKSITINGIDDSRRRITAYGDKIARASLDAYKQAVYNLGAIPCAQYTAAAQTYNQYAIRFNQLAALKFPLDLVSYQNKLIRQLDYETTLDPERLAAAGAGVEQEQKLDLGIPPVQTLPAHAGDLKPTDNPTSNPSISTSGPLDPSAGNIDAPGDNGCGWADKYETGAGKFIDTLVRPLAALGCLMLQGMFQLMINSVGWADCLMNGRELPQICTNSEAQIQKANSANPTKQPASDAAEPVVPGAEGFDPGTSPKTSGSILLDPAPTTDEPTTPFTSGSFTGDQFSAPTTR